MFLEKHGALRFLRLRLCRCAHASEETQYAPFLGINVIPSLSISLDKRANLSDSLCDCVRTEPHGAQPRSGDTARPVRSVLKFQPG